MISKKVVVGGAGCLRAKSAALFVYKAGELLSSIELATASREADGKSLLGVLSLMIANGDEVTVTVNGADEEKAIKVLSEFLENVPE